ncbi:MAG: bifunctional DNA primase/polymerase [Pirellulales bacterium]
MRSMLEAALAYAEMGYPVFPCANQEDPAPLTQHGFKDAVTDLDQIERWWTRFPQACIGLPTAGLVVIDIDGPANPWLADRPDLRLQLMAAPTSLTPGGGRHHIFRQPADRSWSCTTSRLAERVDTRADGGYIVVPPSRRSDGPYRWIDDCELVAPDRLPEPPTWLMAMLDSLSADRSGSGSATTVALGGNAIPSGQRNSTLASLAGTMRRVGMGHAEILAALERTNADRCSPPLPQREVERIARNIARYEPDQVSVAIAENHWEQVFAEPDPEPETPAVQDPGPTPEHLLRVPGFVSEVMDHCLETAPYPNQALAFCGALALQAFLAGRKVRDPGDNRTNIYLLALAYSSVGKDWPRKINSHVLHRIGLSQHLGEKFASGEGIQDALFLTPTMLFQTDEIDTLLQTMKKAQDARYENILGTLLTMYSSANTVYPMRRKAGRESPGVIDQPCLVLLGTAIPTHYYDALSERMLTNGFFARMLIVESGPRSGGQEPGIIDPPERIVETARWWSELNPGSGNLENWHPLPRIVDTTPEAMTLLGESRLMSESEFARAESRRDAVATTVWGRFPEQVRKLALLHAISVRHDSPVIDAAAVKWASELILHQTCRMLFMAQGHVADNPFHAQCLKVVRKLRDSSKPVTRSKLLQHLKIKSADLDQIVATLMEQGDIEPVTIPTATKPAQAFRVPRNLSPMV